MSVTGGGSSNPEVVVCMAEYRLRKRRDLVSRILDIQAEQLDKPDKYFPASAKQSLPVIRIE
jgi:hypothetical protein